MSDPSDVDAAIIAVLRNDPELSTLMPGGVYFDVPPSGVTQYVVVQMTFHEDTYTFDGPAFERTVYMVKAVARHTTDGGTKRAAARIQELLHGQTLTIFGYVHSLTSRVGRSRDTEPDGVDADARWQHRGAQYEVVVSPIPVVVVAASAAATVH